MNIDQLKKLSKELFSVFLDFNIEPYIPVFSIDTIYHFLNHSMKIDNETAKNAIQKLLKFTKMLHSTDETIQRAFMSNFTDFEDALIKFPGGEP